MHCLVLQGRCYGNHFKGSRGQERPKQAKHSKDETGLDMTKEAAAEIASVLKSQIHTHIHMAICSRVGGTGLQNVLNAKMYIL